MIYIRGVYEIYKSVGPPDKTRNGWYLEMVAPISSILDLLVLYSKTFWVCDKLSDSFHGSLARAFLNFSMVLRVNNSVTLMQWSCMLLLLGLATHDSES